MSADKLPAVELVPPTRHRAWVNEHTVPPSEAHDGNERTVRSCAYCGMRKITVHPAHGLPWREWEDKDGARIHVGQTKTPPCPNAGGDVVPAT